MSKTQETISPIDGSVFVRRQLATPQQIEVTLQRASEAQVGWGQSTHEERARICNQMVDVLINQVSELAPELTWQMGRPIRYSPSEITGGFQERARHMITIAQDSLQDIEVPEKSGFIRFIKREPLGTVLVLPPWNYPYLTAVNSVIPAIMAGNTVILKHSNQTPLVAERIVHAFQEAGLPENACQFIHITHDDVAKVIADSRVDFVAFTGSVAGGHAVQRAANERFIATGMELGGKDPAYIRPDANLDHAVENVIDGAFFNSGQSCCGIERIYVHQKVYDTFIEGAVALTKKYVLGNPLDQATTLGPMVRGSAATFVRNQIQVAVEQGAKTLIDPALFPRNEANSPYMAPQILVNVNHGMDIMIEESFGPVVGIMPVASDEEAVALMNDSKYGLTASIWTQDIDAALRIGNQVNTGTWYMNRCDYLDPALAWTGVKDSGHGCTLSTIGYESLTRPKSFHLRVDI